MGQGWAKEEQELMHAMEGREGNEIRKGLHLDKAVGSHGRGVWEDRGGQEDQRCRDMLEFEGKLRSLNETYFMK